MQKKVGVGIVQILAWPLPPLLAEMNLTKKAEQ